MSDTDLYIVLYNEQDAEYYGSVQEIQEEFQYKLDTGWSIEDLQRPNVSVFKVSKELDVSAGATVRIA